MRPSSHLHFWSKTRENISQWKKLSIADRKKAISREWYVQFKYKDPSTNKLKRQNNIKAGANRLKTKEERYKFLSDIRDNLELLLKMGFNPQYIFKLNQTLAKSVFN